MDDAGKGHGATGALLPEPRCHPPEKVTHGRTCGVIVAISPRPPHPRISPMGHGPWTSHHLTPHDLVYPKSDRLSSSSDQSHWLPQSTVHSPPPPIHVHRVPRWPWTWMPEHAPLACKLRRCGTKQCMRAHDLVWPKRSPHGRIIYVPLL
jgi:hypothetical protein